MASRFATIPDYLASLDGPKPQTMQTILDVITKNFPQLQRKIAWNVPQVFIQQTYIFGMAAFKNHLTLNPWSYAIMTRFTPRLHGYVVAKTTFHVPVDWHVDHTLICELVAARMAEATM